jgi:signal transduction histidine kinase
MSRPRGSSTADESGVMLRWVNWVARGLGFLWVGVLAFVVYPPPGGGALAVQAAGYSAAGLGLAAWTVLEGVRRAAPYRGRLLPAVLGVIAAGAGAAAAAASVGGLPLVIFGFVATMAAGSDLSVAAALGGTAAGVLATEVSGLAFSSSIGTLVGLPLVVASGAVIGRNRGAYRIRAEQAAALLAQSEQLQAEQRRADLLDERTRIAREIHDVLAHSLGALSIQIQAARSVLTDRGDIDRASDLLTAAQRMAAEGLTETRRAVQALRDDTLPLEQELARATDTYAQRYRVAAQFSMGGAPRPVPADATIAMLRVAQEGLVNAAKHSAGQAVTVRLDYGAGDVRLVVRNNLAPAGPGDDSRDADGGPGVQTANAGYGLTGMRERLRILSGTLEAGPAGSQWVVTAQLPLPRPESMTS